MASILLVKPFSKDELLDKVREVLSDPVTVQASRDLERGAERSHAGVRREHDDYGKGPYCQPGGEQPPSSRCNDRRSSKFRPLTAREQQVLLLVWNGWTRKSVGGEQSSGPDRTQFKE